MKQRTKIFNRWNLYAFKNRKTLNAAKAKEIYIFEKQFPLHENNFHFTFFFFPAFICQLV